MNVKTIIISTSLSLLFGVYSIYNLMWHLDKTKDSEKYYKEEVDALKISIININEKYNDLLIEFQKIKVNVDILSKNITNLETNKIELISCVSSPRYHNSLEDIIEDISDKNKIICNAQINIPKLNLGLINLVHDNDNDNENDNENSEVKEIKQDQEFEILEQDYVNNVNIVRSRSRGTSITDINWSAATKKFIFG